MTLTATTLRELAAAAEAEYGANTIIRTSRGQGASGPNALSIEDARVDETITEVLETEDTDAWRLARDAADVLGLPKPTQVWLGVERHPPGDFLDANPPQEIYAQ